MRATGYKGKSDVVSPTLALTLTPTPTPTPTLTLADTSPTVTLPSRSPAPVPVPVRVRVPEAAVAVAVTAVAAVVVVALAVVVTVTEAVGHRLKPFDMRASNFSATLILEVIIFTFFSFCLLIKSASSTSVIVVGERYVRNSSGRKECEK